MSKSSPVSDDTSPISPAPDGAPIPSTQAPTLTKAAGTTNTKLTSLQLTESQLTLIASKLLQHPLCIRFEKKKIFDDTGKSVGFEDTAELDIYFRDNAKKELFDIALEAASPKATLTWLTRLAIHKRLGSSEQDRAILLTDYCSSLRPYSPFVVYAACRAFWETDPNDFFPKIRALTEICETLHSRITAQSRKLLQIEGPSSRQFRLRREEDTEQGLERRRRICDFIVSQNGPDYFDQVRSYSNYQLEGLAKTKYGYQG